MLKRRSKGSYPRLSNIIVLSVLIGFAYCIKLGVFLSAPAAEPPFSLFVTIEFSAEIFKEQFLKDIQPVAAYVKSHEPTTLAYEVLLSDQKPLQVLIMERYQDKEVAYLQIHKSSAPFLEFRPKLQRLQEAKQVTISGHSFLDSGVGFGDRA